MQMDRAAHNLDTTYTSQLADAPLALAPKCNLPYPITAVYS